MENRALNPALLLEGLAAKDFDARAAAVRILKHNWLPRPELQQEWRDCAKALALDENPRVRLEAIVCSAAFPVPNLRWRLWRLSI